MSSFIFTSEAVSQGHPDKVSDQVSDAVLDALLAGDPQSRVACETLCTTNFVCLAGEIRSETQVDFEKIARDVCRDIGYVGKEMMFDADSFDVDVRLHQQSADIAQGVDAGEDKDTGAGDQGLMFGYACDQTPELMPLPIALSHRILNRLTDLRHAGDVSWLRPDSKSQVSIRYEGETAVGIDAVVVSTQHDESVEQKELHEYIIEQVVKPCDEGNLIDDSTKYHINPTGRFVIGGPHGDCGLTGRKIIVDTYGGWGRHGGGAFSGKDSTKVDRSAAYMARYIAKNVVAAGLARRCEIQLAYAIGVSEPVSIDVDTDGTSAATGTEIANAIREVFQLTPRGIIESLQLRRPIFRQTSFGGHFGRDLPDFSWEQTDKAEKLKELLG